MLFSWLRVSVFSALVSAASLVSAQARQRVIVITFNDVGVGNPIVLEAEKTVSRIYNGAGIVVVWNNCEPHREPYFNDCVQASGRRVFLRLRNQPRTSGSEVYGIAFLDKQGRGEHCAVFYDRVADLYHRGRASQSKILAIVMAHELGHLLLGSHAHSQTGIMRPKLQERDFWTLDLAATAFTNQQRKTMSDTLSQAASMNASEGTRVEIEQPLKTNP